MKLRAFALLLGLASLACGPTPGPKPVASQDKPVRIQFINSDVADIMLFYGSLTGRKVRLEPDLSGKISIFTQQTIARAQAITLIEDTLRQNGYDLREPSDGEVYVSRM